MAIRWYFSEDDMARKVMFTKQEILNAALDITRESGFLAVTARAIGNKLGTSYRPICSFFENMSEVQNAVIKEANEIYQNYLKEDMSSGKYPPYKASGMAYIRFAREEKELFKLLFMRERTNEEKSEFSREFGMLSELICKQINGITKEKATLFYLEMWTYVHGIATMIATNFYDWDEDLCSCTLTDMYLGLKEKYENK